MTESFGSLAHLANELDVPLQASIKRLYKIIEEYKSRDFEYISYKDFKNIFNALETIHRQLLRCSVTSNRLLTDGKRKARLNPASSNVNELISDIVKIIEKQIESNIRFKLHLSANLPLVGLGHVECFQVINNLVMNAVQSMPAGGLITIKSKLDTHKKIAITIQDQGVGMSKEFLATIFEPHRGGLGLAVVHALVTICGGNITIKSSLRKGTTVSLILPVFTS